MDRFYKNKRQSVTNYLDIFKSCRLCGAGGGYKMPIIQALRAGAGDVIDVEAELKQKIKECVSIEVHPDDRMPPLICELCVDKINDFYEFREMCRATNARVRASLGLPPQALSQDVNEDCILGVSGPVFHSSKESDIISKKDKPKSKKSGIVEKKVLRSQDSSPITIDRSTRRRQAESPLPAPASKKLRFSTPSPSAGSSFLEKKKAIKTSESLAAHAKKLREGKNLKIEEPKKGNLLQKQKELLAQKAKENKAKELAEKLKKKAKELKDAQKAREAQKAKLLEQRNKEAALRKKLAAAAASAAPTFKCDHCNQSFSKQVDCRQHTNFMHTPLYMEEKMACTPCGEWFVTLKDAETHHRWHKTSNTYYTCKRCSTDFKVLMGFTKHFQRKQCVPYEIVPDVKCPVCMGMFATENWMRLHKCSGPPKDMCKMCMSVFQGRAALKKHERRCKGIIVPVNPNNPHLKELRPLSISVDRCDHLVRRIKLEPGLVTNIKQEPLDFEESSINIKQEIKQEMEDYDYGGMDDGGYSTDGSVSDTGTPHAPHMVFNPFARKSTTQVESLSFISLRSIFDGKLLGSRTKKRKTRNPKLEVETERESAPLSLFDSLFGNNDNPNEGIVTVNPTTNVFDSGCATNPQNDKELHADQTDTASDSLDQSTRLCEEDGKPENDKELHTDQTDTASDSLDKSTSLCEEDGKPENDKEIHTEETNIEGLGLDSANIDNIQGGGCHTLVENVLNEIIERTDSELGALSNPSECNVVNSQQVLTSQEDNVAPSKSDSINQNSTIEIVREEGVQSEQLSVGKTTSDAELLYKDVENKKSFLESFVLYPEVEALLMEDEESPSGDICDSVGKALDGDVDPYMTPELSRKCDGIKESSEDTSINSNGELSPHICNERNDNSILLKSMDPVYNDKQSPSATVADEPPDNGVVNKFNHFYEERKSVIQNVASEMAEDDCLKDLGNESSDTVEVVSEATCKDCSVTDVVNDEVIKDSVGADTRCTEDVLDLVSDSGDDCNIIDSPDKAKFSQDQLLNDESKSLSKEGDIDHLLDTPQEQKEKVLDSETLNQEKSKSDQMLSEDNLIDEDSLLTAKDDGTDFEMSQQDEEILLGKDDNDDLQAQSSILDMSNVDDQDLEKISDGEFDVD